MIAHAAAALALVLAQATATQGTAPPRPCFTADEAGAGAAVMMPEFVNALATGCRPHLAEDAYLRAHGDELIARWRGESAGQRQVAHAAMMRMIPPQAMAQMQAHAQHGTAGAAPTPPAPAAGPPPDPMAMVHQMMQGMSQTMAEKLNPVTCKEASRFVEALAPLPATNFAQMVSAMIGIGVAVAPPKGDDGPPICRP